MRYHIQSGLMSPSPSSVVPLTADSLQPCRSLWVHARRDSRRLLWVDGSRSCESWAGGSERTRRLIPIRSLGRRRAIRRYWWSTRPCCRWCCTRWTVWIGRPPVMSHRHMARGDVTRCSRRCTSWSATAGSKRRFPSSGSTELLFV
jgi:hypothetical protein